MNGVAAIAALAAGACATAVWLSAGTASLAYAVIYVLAVIPGLPLGFSLFGRRHPAGWVAGALLGYGLTQLALWFTIVSGLASPAGFASVWLVLTGVAVLIVRAMPPRPAVVLPSWDLNDWRALLLVLCLVPLLMGPPYRNLGRADEDGDRRHRRRRGVGTSGPPAQQPTQHDHRHLEHPQRD